ncbi:MAG: GGDEF domain-containing protein [Beijerinckiaceae bacterium]
MNATVRDEAGGLDEARRAIDLIEMYRSPPDVRAFAVWSAYAKGDNTALKMAVDQLIAQKSSLSHSDVEFVFRAYLGEENDSLRPERLSTALIREVDRILEAVELAAGSANRYSESLSSVSTRLGEDLDRDSLQALIRNLSEITRQTIADNETLTAHLTATRAEAQSLRDSLAIVRTESLTDDLTKLWNRRHFDSVIAALLGQVQKAQRSLALLMLDIDHFKRFNDLHGHQTGDQVLKLVAGTVLSHLRDETTAARYGGEEIAILLPDHDLARATRVAETIRIELRSRELVKRLNGEKLGRVTVSVGLALAKPHDTVAAFIDRADRCLMQAKAHGRDRTICESELPPFPGVRKSA